MPTFLTDKCTEIRKWFAIGEEVYPNDVVTSWIRMAEEYLSTALRVKHMIQIDTATIVNDRVALPLDWQEVKLVRFTTGGGVCRYQSPDAFYNPEFPDDPRTPYEGKKKRYTILGNYIVLGDATGDDPGFEVELTYYQNIPALTNDVNTWPNIYHPTVFTLKILHIASLYAIEDERGPTWAKEVENSVNAMNIAHKVDQASGSVLVQTRRKTFG